MRRNPARAVAVITAVLAAVSITVVSHVMRARVSAALEVSREQTRRILEQEREMAGREASAIRQLSRSLFLQGVQYAETDRTGPALAHWAEAVRLNPSNSAAAARIFHTLARHHFPQPAFAPAENHGKVMACVFSPDGSRVAAVTQGARQQFWLRDAAHGSTPALQPAR